MSCLFVLFIVFSPVSTTRTVTVKLLLDQATIDGIMADIEEPHDSLCDRALVALEHFVGQHHARASEPCDDAARTYADEGELREAATHLTRALELGDAGQSSAEDVADLRCVRAKVELLRGRWDGAEADAEMALAALTGLIDDTYLASAVAFNGKNNNRSGTWESAPYDAHFLVLETKRAVARLLLSQAMRAQGKLGPPTESLLRAALTAFESLARAGLTNGTATAAAAAAAAVSNEATARAALGTYCMHVGRLPEAEDHHRAALAMRERACTGR